MQFFHPFQLIPAHRLRMDHHRAQAGGLWAKRHHLLITGNQLLGRRIAVAVGQKLHAIPQSCFDELHHLCIGIDRVSTITIRRIFIRLAHPGCAPLRGAVQNNLVATQPEVISVSFTIFRVLLQEGRALLKICKAHRIHMQRRITHQVKTLLL